MSDTHLPYGERMFMKMFKKVQNNGAHNVDVTIHGHTVTFQKFPKYGGGTGIATLVDGRRLRWNDALDGIRALDKQFPEGQSEISEGEGHDRN